jgi:hypothetical protein
VSGKPISPVGPSYNLADRKAACQRSVNLRPVKVEDDGHYILQDVDGWETLFDVTDPIRGQYSTGARQFVVHANEFVEMFGAVPTARGTLSTSTGFVSMKHNATQLAVVDGTYLYIFDLATNVLTLITSLAWLGSNFVDYLDGYFIFVRPNSEQFYISAVDDGTSLDALDFSSADRQPDKIITHRVFKGEIYLFGEKSVEPWVNSGANDFPFVRYNSTPVEVGICGERAVTTTIDSLVWVDPHGFVYSMSAYQPMRISTQAIEELLEGADLSTCVAWTYQIAGAEFVGIEADGVDTTLVYDIATKQWHERARGSSSGWIPLGIHSVIFHNGTVMAAYGSLVLTRNHSVQRFAGYPIVRDRVWPHMVSPSLEQITYRSLELRCSTGYGGACFLQISNDGGRTWGSPLIKYLGVTGRWNERIRWQLLGSANDRVFRLGCSDDVPFSIYAATVDA